MEEGIENTGDGRVAEWLKAPDSKSGLGAILTGVRIPPLPPRFVFYKLYKTGSLILQLG
jgi:hypothetical protein